MKRRSAGLEYVESPVAICRASRNTSIQRLLLVVDQPVVQRLLESRTLDGNAEVECVTASRLTELVHALAIRRNESLRHRFFCVLDREIELLAFLVLPLDRV